MPKQIDYTLTDEELIEIEHAIKHNPCAEVMRRATANRLFHQDHRAVEIAVMVARERDGKASE